MLRFFCMLNIMALLLLNAYSNFAYAQNLTTQPTTPPPNTSATQPPSSSSPAPQVINQSDGTQVTIQTYFCPQSNQLIKNGLYWGTSTGGWKSYSESFDTTVVSFVGAQWVGINVGKMVCIYKGNLPISFPITIQNDTLSQVPSGGLWGNDLGGYRNCHSGNVLDCPFVVKTQTVNIQQIYESLDFFKGKPNPLNQNNS